MKFLCKNIADICSIGFHKHSTSLAIIRRSVKYRKNCSNCEKIPTSRLCWRVTVSSGKKLLHIYIRNLQLSFVIS